MTYLGDLVISLQDANGNYLTATQNNDTTWTITPIVQKTFIDHLPESWNETEIMWSRDPQYLGVFRSQSKSFGFITAARAILKSISVNGSVQGYAKISFWAWNETTFNYDLAYQSRLNFGGAKNKSLSRGGDKINDGIYTASTFDSDLYQLLEAWGGNEYNIPFWKYIGNNWGTDAITVLHTGIKLLYSATFVSGATIQSPQPYTLDGFNHGDEANGRHTIPSMSLAQITQNNGTTTFIGNDILNNNLLQGKQIQFLNEAAFAVSPNSRPFTQQNYIFYNLLDDVEMAFSMDFAFDGLVDIAYNWNFPSGLPYISVVLYEVTGIDDQCTTVGGEYAPIHLFDIKIGLGGTGTGSPQTFTPPAFLSTVNTYTMGAPIPAPYSNWISYPTDFVTLKKGYVYTVGLIYDYIDTFAMPPGNNASFSITTLSVTGFSLYNSGAANPVSAPMFPQSPLLAFRPAQVLEKLVPCLNSLITDPTGFPLIPADTPYTGRSDYLSDDTIQQKDNFDNIPWATAWTSGSALQDLPGQPYIQVSVNDFFQTCFSIWGMGLGIENDADGNPTVIRMEPLSYFFDRNTMICDLGDSIADLVCSINQDILVNLLQGGYNTQNTNNDFGVDAFCREQDYNTPLTQIRQTNLNIIASAVVAEMYYIEKLRSQQAESPLPVSATSSQSNANDNILLEINVIEANDDGTPLTVIIQDPSGNVINSPYYNLLQYPNAQSLDPTAATAPFIKGLYYPDTAVNAGLTPVKNIMRLGGYLASLCDGSLNEVLTFRHIYQMLFSGVATELPGIQTNIKSGLINEIADIPISNLEDQLFRPWVFEFTSNYPVNMYQLIQNNPRGYIQFKWGVRVYKGFIWKVSQKIANRAATTFTLLAHPDTSNDDLLAI